jgi:hypothetical protein
VCIRRTGEEPRVGVSGPKGGGRAGRTQSRTQRVEWIPVVRKKQVSGVSPSLVRFTYLRPHMSFAAAGRRPPLGIRPCEIQQPSPVRPTKCAKGSDTESFQNTRVAHRLQLVAAPRTVLPHECPSLDERRLFVD